MTDVTPPTDPFEPTGPTAGSAEPPTQAPPAYASAPAVPPPVPASGSSASWKAWVGAGAAAAVLAVGAGFVIGRSGHDSNSNVASAGAANQTAGYGNGQFQGGPGGRFGRGTQGTISAIDGSTLTVKADDGTATTVKTTSDTTVTEAKAGKVSDIAKGDHVLVVGTTSGTTVAATRVVDNGDLELTGPGAGFGGPPGGATQGSQTDGQPSTGELPGGQAPGGFQRDGGGFPTAGTVSSIDGSTLTVTTAAGDTIKVTTSSDTTVTVTTKESVSDLKVGDTVRVMGDTSGTTVTATNIRTGTVDGGFGFGPGGDGQGRPDGNDAGGGNSGGLQPPSGTGSTTQTTI